MSIKGTPKELLLENDKKSFANESKEELVRLMGSTKYSSWNLTNFDTRLNMGIGYYVLFL